MNQLRQAFNILNHQGPASPLDENHARESIELTGDRLAMSGDAACNLCLVGSRADARAFPSRGPNVANLKSSASIRI